MSKGLRLLLGGVGCLLLLSVPLLVEQQYYLHILIVAGLDLAVVLGVSLLFHMGLVSIGHSAFVGVGAYTTALLMVKGGWNFGSAAVAACVVAAGLGLVVGFLTLRTKGIYFSVITFAFGEFTRLVFLNWKDAFGGATGIINIPAPGPLPIPGLQEITFATKGQFYYLVLLLVLLVGWLSLRILRSEAGLMLSAIREADVLAESTGVPVTHYRISAFTFSCAVAGLAGGLYAPYYHYISPVAFTFMKSTDYVIMAVVGGPGTVAGPILSTLLLVALPEVLRPIRGYQLILYGLTLMAVIYALPGGVSSLLEKASRRRQTLPEEVTRNHAAS